MKIYIKYNLFLQRKRIPSPERELSDTLDDSNKIEENKNAIYEEIRKSFSLEENSDKQEVEDNSSSKTMQTPKKLVHHYTSDKFDYTPYLDEVDDTYNDGINEEQLAVEELEEEQQNELEDEQQNELEDDRQQIEDDASAVPDESKLTEYFNSLVESSYLNSGDPKVLEHFKNIEITSFIELRDNIEQLTFMETFNRLQEAMASQGQNDFINTSLDDDNTKKLFLANLYNKEMDTEHHHSLFGFKNDRNTKPTFEESQPKTTDVQNGVEKRSCSSEKSEESASRSRVPFDFKISSLIRRDEPVKPPPPIETEIDGNGFLEYVGSASRDENFTTKTRVNHEHELTVDDLEKVDSSSIVTKKLKVDDNSTKSDAQKHAKDESKYSFQMLLDDDDEDDDILEENGRGDDADLSLDDQLKLSDISKDRLSLESIRHGNSDEVSDKDYSSRRIERDLIRQLKFDADSRDDEALGLSESSSSLRIPSTPFSLYTINETESTSKAKIPNISISKTTNNSSNNSKLNKSDAISFPINKSNLSSSKEKKSTNSSNYHNHKDESDKNKLPELTRPVSLSALGLPETPSLSVTCKVPMVSEEEAAKSFLSSHGFSRNSTPFENFQNLLSQNDKLAAQSLLQNCNASNLWTNAYLQAQMLQQNSNSSFSQDSSLLLPHSSSNYGSNLNSSLHNHQNPNISSHSLHQSLYNRDTYGLSSQSMRENSSSTSKLMNSSRDSTSSSHDRESSVSKSSKSKQGLSGSSSSHRHQSVKSSNVQENSSRSSNSTRSNLGSPSYGRDGSRRPLVSPSRVRDASNLSSHHDLRHSLMSPSHLQDTSNTSSLSLSHTLRSPLNMHDNTGMSSHNMNQALRSMQMQDTSMRNHLQLTDPSMNHSLRSLHENYNYHAHSMRHSLGSPPLMHDNTNSHPYNMMQLLNSSSPAERNSSLSSRAMREGLGSSSYLHQNVGLASHGSHHGMGSASFHQSSAYNMMQGLGHLPPLHRSPNIMPSLTSSSHIPQHSSLSTNSLIHNSNFPSHNLLQDPTMSTHGLMDRNIFL